MTRLVDYLDKDQRIAALCARVEKLEAEAAAQRKAGAVWALRDQAKVFQKRRGDIYGPTVAEYLLRAVDSIEADEVEVPE